MKARWIGVGLGGVVALLTTASDLCADPLDRWTWLYPQPQGVTLRAVTYGNGLFVAVGDHGTIVTSGDGYHWTKQTSGAFPALLGVAYSGGIYAAAGVAGTVVTSSNGITWTQQPALTTNTLRAISGNPLFPTFSNKRFCAVGDFGTVFTSSDSVSWVQLNTGTANSFRGVTHAFGAVFLCVGDSGTLLLTDSPGQPRNVGATRHLQTIAYENSIFAAAGDFGSFSPPMNSMLYSSDLLNWSAQNLNGDGFWFPSAAFTIHGMAFGNNRFVAVGDTGHTLEYNYPGVLLISDTGTNWTELGALTSENSLRGVAFGNGLFVAVGDAGAIVVSTNGVNWSEITSYHRTAITAIACGDNMCLASGAPAPRVYSFLRFPDFTLLVSSNGTDWCVASTNLPAMSDLLASGSLFVGVSDNCIYTTTNGFDWTSNCLSSQPLHGIGYGNGLFFVVGDNGTIYSSADCLSWSNRSVTTSGRFYCASYGNGIYVAAGTAVATSGDGIEWSLSPTNPPLRLTRIAYANRTFVAAGDIGTPYYYGGSLLTSDDGQSWLVRFTGPLSFESPALTYGNGTFLAVIKGGNVIKSPDGVHWFSSPTILPFLDSGWGFIYYPRNPYSPGVCAYNGRFIAGGYDGILMQSGDTRVPILADSPRVTDLGFSFSFNPQIGEPYRVQMSTNLEFWENLYGDVAAAQPTTFSDSSATISPKRFFRVVSP